jgi:hypothetical protein
MSFEHVFTQNSVTVFGSSYLDRNSDLQQFKTKGMVDGLDPTKMVLVNSGGFATQSTMSVLVNAAPLKHNLWINFNADIMKYNPATDDYDRVLLLNSMVNDVVEVDGNLYYVDYNVLYDEARNPLHTLTAAEGNFFIVIDGGDGSLYLHAMGGTGYDRDHGFFQYNISTGTMTRLASFNTDELDFVGTNGLGFINGKLQIIFSSAHGNFNKTSWGEFDGSTLNIIEEIDGKVASDFDVAVVDGRIRATFMMPYTDEVITLDQAIAPTITGSAAPINVAEDHTGTTDLSAITDNPDDIKEFGSIDNSGLGTVDINGNILTFTPAAHVSGTATVTIAVAEVAGGSTTETTVEVTVAPMNDDPTSDTDSETIIEVEDSPNQSIDLDDDFSDVEGDTMTYSITDQPPDASTGVTGTITGSIFDVSFADNVFGTFTFVVQADNGNGGTGSKTFIFERTAIDDPPQLVGDIDDISTPVDSVAVIPATQINDLYDDPDSDNTNFEFRPSSDDETVVTATMNEAGDLVISSQSVGTAKITLNMTSNDLSPDAVAEFIVTVTQASSNEVESRGEKFQITHYPNPVPRGHVMNTQVSLEQPTEISIEVFNLLGQRVLRQTIGLGSGKNRIQIPTRGLASGQCFMRAQLPEQADIIVEQFTVIK